MADPSTTIKQAYDAFNHRDIPAALALMADDVSWPKASEGGRVTGKAEIAAYWTRQWQQFDPQVTPLSLKQQPDGTVLVRVHQLVRSLPGNVLSDSEVNHRFTLHGNLITAMHLADDTAQPTAAFTHP